MTVQLQALDRELDRLEGLWSDGLSETYRAYLDSVGQFAAETQPKLALAAALIEVGLRLQGRGGRAAPPTTLLMGDLCLARGSRLLLTTRRWPSRWLSLARSSRCPRRPRPSSRPRRLGRCLRPRSEPGPLLGHN